MNDRVRKLLDLVEQALEGGPDCWPCGPVDAGEVEYLCESLREDLA